MVHAEFSSCLTESVMRFQILAVLDGALSEGLAQSCTPAEGFAFGGTELFFCPCTVTVTA